MGKEYDIIEVIRLRDEEKLKWKEIELIIGVSLETLRKTYKRTKEKKTYYEANPTSYKTLKKRGLERKIYFINKLGGCCSKCGYKHNIAVLEFHHRNPKEKEFWVDARAFSNYSLEKLEKELEKCDLLCANCHREHHNPKLTIENIQEIIGNVSDKKSFNNQNKYGSVCPVCGKRFPKSTGKIYCSEECRWKAKGYPSIKEVNEQYEVLGSWEKAAQYFGLTRKIMQGIRKKYL